MNRSTFSRVLSLVLTLAFVFSVIPASALAIVGEQSESATYICGLDAHSHVDACYQHELKDTCGLEEGAYECGITEGGEHTHDASCISHTHSDACKSNVKTDILICELVEHAHSEACVATVDTTPTPTPEVVVPTPTPAAGVDSTPTPVVEEEADPTPTPTPTPAPVSSIAEVSSDLTKVDYVEGENDYYKVITKKDYALAPGIVESEIVLNNAAGSHRQVAHVVEVDLDNPYTKVIPSYKGMVPTPGSYGVQIMSQQAAWAEANGYGNVVAAMNLSLSWYDSAYYTEHPELVGEPLGYMILDGVQYTNSQGMTSGAQTCVVINFDEKDGVARPADIPKVEIRSTSSAITGWEEQVIPANFGFLVKDGKNQYTVDNNATNGASRSFVGIKADGTFVMVMNDGRQSPYSAGFTNYEMAEFMIALGCVQAVNGDGGGSSAFLSQRPGEDLKLNCSPSDGAERPTTHGILVISTAPSTGEFVRATITAENDYYTPGSTVKFSALGTDLVGTKTEIPADASWQLVDPSMGTIENGVFVSNGKVGTATAQLVYNGVVVGEASVEIVIPTEFAFAQAVMTVPFDKEVTIALTATINDGLHEVVLKPADVTFATDNSALGTFNGFQFTSVSTENAPENLTSTLTATLVHDTSLVATAALNLGKGSEVLFDFEEATDVEEWNIADVNGNDQGFYQHLSHATAADGQVHDGVGSMRVEMNPISAIGIPNGGYAQSDLFLDEGIVVENAKSIGFWAYIPDEYEHCWIRVLYWYDPDGDGKFDKKSTISVINQPEVYNTWDESGWKYFSVDVSAYSKVLIPGLDSKDLIAYNASKNDANNFRFIEFMFPHTNTNDLWKTYGTINGLQTVYIDNITADFSDAVEDREAPIFGTVSLAENDEGIALEKYNTVTTTSNTLTVSAKVAENTTKTNATGLNISSAKAYVDGVEVDVSVSNGRMTISDVVVADGVHRVKFEICDNAGNKSVVIRLIEVDSGADASTIQVVPADATLDKLYGGSVYWMDLNATDIETIQSIKTVIDLNYGNHWELDHMVLAAGFEATYTIDEENNTATITITRTGSNTQTGEATIASLPIRVIYYDADIKIDDYTAETYWNTYGFWPYDLKVDVDMGEITYVEGYSSSVLNAFSNEEFSVATELYTAFNDTAFKSERGTAHVHSLGEAQDKDATGTEAGYKGRVFCTVCDSPVDWGETIPAAGHTYTVVDGKLVCSDCGEEYKVGTGLFEMNENWYYAIADVLQSGWQYIESEDENSTGYYYFSTTDYSAVDGNKIIDGYEYTFENNILVRGTLVTTSTGIQYMWAGKWLVNSWTTIDGEKYYFAGNGAAKVGPSTVRGETGTFAFDETGIWLEGRTGLLTIYDRTYYYENGMCKAAGLVKVGEDYYYIGSDYKITVGLCWVANPNTNTTGYTEGEYEFDENGKMLRKVEKNGPINGVFYLNGVRQKAYQLVEFEGDYYFIGDNHMLARSCTLYLGEDFVAGSRLTAGYYEFDADGKLVVKNGPVNGRFYIDGVMQRAYQLVEYEGDYYFISDSHMLAKNCTLYLGESFVAGTAFNPGYYEFDADGKIVIKNGPVGEHFYINGIMQRAYQLVRFGEDYYFINDAHRLAKNCTLYLGESFVEGTDLSAGYYEFDADGKLLVKNGPVGGRFYINGIMQRAYQLVEYEGDYYFISDGHMLAKNCTLYLTEKFVSGTSLGTGYYSFDSDGKMVVKNGPVGGYFYINGVMQRAYQLVEYEGDYYFISDGHKVATSCTIYLLESFLYKYELPAGKYSFDATGKMLLKNGPVGDRFYIDGIMQNAYQLVEYEGNYYFISDGNKLAKNCTIYLKQAFVYGTGLPEGKYTFDSDGKMIIN